VVARSLVEALRPYRQAWQDRLDEVGVRKKAELEAWRKSR
jgi:hypothetical protein